MPEDALPGGRRETQPTVLVTGRARALLRRVPLRLLAERGRPGDAAVVVTTRRDPAVVARRLCGAVAAFDPSVLALVDATSEATTSPRRVDERRWHVPSPVAFGHLRAAIDEALDVLGARDGVRVHVLFDTLTTQFLLADADAVLQHAHDLATALGAERGLGLFTMAPRVARDDELGAVCHLVDVHVGVRRTAGGPQVRWTGLVGGTGGWVALAETALRFDAPGQRLE